MNRLTTRIATLVLTAAAAATFTVTAASAQTTPATGDAARGHANFLKYGCYECHGTVAQGNYTGIPHLAPHPIPQAALISYIRKPGGVMPSYSAAILPDKDAADIWAYLSSLPATKPVSSIPALAGVTMKAK